MIDIGLNLLVHGALMGVNPNEVDDLVTSIVRRADPYAMLRRSKAQAACPREDSLQKLAAGVGVTLEAALGDIKETAGLLLEVAKKASDDDFFMSGTVYMDNEGTCIAHFEIAVELPGDSQMAIEIKLEGLTSEDARVKEAAVSFLANDQWLDFDLDADLIDLDNLMEQLESRRDFELFAKGIMIFGRGPYALAEYLRASCSEDVDLWVKEGGGGADGIELYLRDDPPPDYSAKYTATIGEEEYEILLGIDGGRVWDIRATWSEQFTFNVYWLGGDDAWLQLIVQNAYESYDIAHRIADDVLNKSAPASQGESLVADSGEEDTYSNGLKPGYDITTYRSYGRPIEPVRIGDLVVRSAVRTCGNPKHDIREVIAVVCVFAPGVGITEVAVDAFCCPQCKRYFVLEEDFLRLKKKGALCCRVVTQAGTVREFIPGRSVDLSEQSFYNSLGYNVSSQEGLSPEERRTILDFAIANGFKSQKATIGFLQWLIDFNGRRKNMDEAVRKWRSDIRYLMSAHDAAVERVKIDRVFLTEHRW